MADPVTGKTIEIGGARRTLRFDFQAFRIAEKRFGGKPIAKILDDMGIDAVCELAAAGLFGEDRLMSAERVSGWLENEPTKFYELKGAVLDAISAAGDRMSPRRQPGEASAPATTTGAGTTPEAGQTSPG